MPRKWPKSSLVMPSPEHQGRRLIPVEPCLPGWIRLDVCLVVVDQVHLECCDALSREIRNFIDPKVQVVRFDIRIVADMAGASRGKRQMPRSNRCVAAGPVEPLGPALLPHRAETLGGDIPILEDHGIHRGGAGQRQPHAD